MSDELKGKKVAILIDNGFEEVEMTEPRQALERAGAEVDIVSPQKDEVKAWAMSDWGDTYPVDVPLDRVRPGNYDALMLPGGVMNPDRLRRNPKAVRFVKSFVESDKPIAAICHGPWTLIEAGGVKNHKMTSWPSLQTDLRNAGAEWVDQKVIVDRCLVTSRKPDDIPDFNRKMIQEFAEHPEHKTSRSAGRTRATSRSRTLRSTRRRVALR